MIGENKVESDDSSAIDNEMNSNEADHGKVGDTNEKKGIEIPEQGETRSMNNLYATVYAFNMFTLTDGAVRVIVLLHANSLGFTPIEIAIMFSLYEVAGVFTNLFGGIAGTRYGLKCTLFTSCILQLIGLTCLSLIETIFGDLEYASDDIRVQATVYITFCQALSGVAKDFMKLSCKSVPKLVTKEGENSALFKMVAWVTGLKNTIKGVGHILGGVLVEFAGFVPAVIVLVCFIVLIVPVPLKWMDGDLGQGSKKNARFNCNVFKKARNVNILSFARFFLFGSRDVWFEIAAPIFIREILQWPEFSIGLFMGSYIVVYGNFQTASSKAYKSPDQNTRFSCLKGPPNEKHVANWAFVSCVDLAIWGSILYPLYREFVDSGGIKGSGEYIGLSAILLVGLFVFALFFAVNSAIHSYLIVLYSGKDKLAMDMGFYYMANAMGRLVGTMLSGVIYQFTQEQFGLSMCLWVASFFMLFAGLTAKKLNPNFTFLNGCLSK